MKKEVFDVWKSNECFAFNCEDCAQIDFAALFNGKQPKTPKSAENEIKKLSRPSMLQNSVTNTPTTSSTLSTRRSFSSGPPPVKRTTRNYPDGARPVKPPTVEKPKKATKKVENATNVVESVPPALPLQRSNVVSGTSKEGKLKVAKKQRRMGIYNLDPSITPEIVETFLNGVILCNAKCTRIIPDGMEIEKMTFASFVASVDDECIESLMNPSIWEEGIRVKELKWGFRRGQDQPQKPPYQKSHRSKLSNIRK